MPELPVLTNDVYEEQKKSLDDDPVVSEIPVYLNNSTGPNLVLLQYPTRTSNASAADGSHPISGGGNAEVTGNVRMQDSDVAEVERLTNAGVCTTAISSVRLKPQSRVIEVDLHSQVPSPFINANSTTSSNMGLTQAYNGVLNSNEGRYAIGFMHNNELYLNLVPQTAQLRPQFAPPEPVSSSFLQMRNSQAGTSTGNNTQASDGQVPALQSVQMSVKPTSTESPKHSSVLDFWRRANKEEPVEYNLRDEADDRAKVLTLIDANEAGPVDCNIDVKEQMTFL